MKSYQGMLRRQFSQGWSGPFKVENGMPHTVHSGWVTGVRFFTQGLHRYPEGGYFSSEDRIRPQRAQRGGYIMSSNDKNAFIKAIIPYFAPAKIKKGDPFKGRPKIVSTI